MSIKLIIADDHNIVREGITALLKELKGNDIEITGSVSNGKELLEIFHETIADIYLIDLSMPFLNGFDASREILKQNPNAKIIIFSMLDSKNLVDQALRIGIKGYLSKEYSAKEIVRAIDEVMTGNIYLCSSVSNLVIEDFFGKNKSEQLTKREKEILKLLVQGMPNKNIALKLSLSIDTVNVHKKHIMKKLNLHKQTDLIHYAIKEGISYL